MPKYLFAGLMLLFYVICGAQSQLQVLADTGLKVRQLPNSEADVQDYFQDLQSETDTLYAVIFRPSNCPRCEAIINEASQHLREIQSHPFAIISVFPDSIIAKEYTNRMGFKSDYQLYDTNDNFDKFLSFSYGSLHVPYLLKIAIKTGDMIYGMDLNTINENLFEELVNFNISLPKKSYLIGHSEIKELHDSNDALKVASIRKLDVSMKSPSEIKYTPLLYDGHLYMNDKLSTSIYHYEENEGGSYNFVNVIEADSIEQRMFVDIPMPQFEQLVQSNLIKFMALKPFILDKEHIAVSYSLPKVWLEDSVNLAYMNAPCCIVRDLGGTQKTKMINLQFPNDEYFYAHFTPCRVKDNIAIEMELYTWPMNGNRTEFEGIDKMDPMNDKFYAYPHPVVALFGTDDGELKCQIGQLPDFAKKYKTGYSFANSIFSSYENEFADALVYSGEIYISQLDNIECEQCAEYYKIFDVDEAELPNPDNKYSEEYINYLSENMSKKIVDLKFNDDSVVTIVQIGNDPFNRPYKNKYQLFKINRESKEIAVRNFPSSSEYSLQGIGVGQNSNGEITLFDLIKDTSRNWSLRTFEL